MNTCGYETARKLEAILTSGKQRTEFLWNIPEEYKEKCISGIMRTLDIKHIEKAIIDRLDNVSEEVICDGFQIISSMGEYRWEVVPIPDNSELNFAFLINEAYGDGITIIRPAAYWKREKILRNLIEEVAEELATSMYSTVRLLDYDFRIVFTRQT